MYHKNQRYLFMKNYTFLFKFTAINATMEALKNLNVLIQYKLLTINLLGLIITSSSTSFYNENIVYNNIKETKYPLYANVYYRYNKETHIILIKKYSERQMISENVFFWVAAKAYLPIKMLNRKIRSKKIVKFRRIKSIVFVYFNIYKSLIEK